MANQSISRRRIVAAFIIAATADLIQFPVNAVTATGILAIPGEFADFLLDCAVMGATSLLIGFHWLLLPSMLVEVIPGLDLVPTWTGCVAAVVGLRKAERPLLPTIDMEETKPMGASPDFAIPMRSLSASSTLGATSAHLPSEEASIEMRLQRLTDLFGRQLISQSEYEAKRQQILSEL